MIPPTKPSYAGYRFPPEVISHAIWLYFRFPLSLRMVEEMLAARGILVSHETVRQWALKFGQAFANQIRRRLPYAGDKWHLDEVVILSAKSGGLGKSGEGVYPCLGARQPVQPANHP
jgi:putative transposase